MHERLKEIRLSLVNQNGKKFTQTEFAKEMSVTRDMIATYELGKVVPSDLYISTLCNKFGINEVWLRTGVGEMKAPLSRSEEVALITKRLMQDEEPAYREELIKVISDMDLETIKLWYDYAKKWVNNVEKSLND